MAWASYLHVVPAVCLGFLISGWIVGRMHRRHLAAVLFAFILTVLATDTFGAQLVGFARGRASSPSRCWCGAATGPTSTPTLRTLD